MFEDRSDVLALTVPPVLTAAFARELTDRLANLPDHAAVVALVQTDAALFCTGMDLEALVAAGAGADDTIIAIGEALTSLHLCSRATLAVASGRAVGGGIGLLAACDYVVAARDATFGLPEMLWGFVPAAIWPLVVARIGPARAKAWATTAFARSAEDALSAGLVDELADAPQLGAAARRAAKNLARVDRNAIPLLRSWTCEVSTMTTADAIHRGAELSAEQLRQPRVRERLATFFRDGAAPWQTPGGDS